MFYIKYSFMNYNYYEQIKKSRNMDITWLINGKMEKSKLICNSN